MMMILLWHTSPTRASPARGILVLYNLHIKYEMPLANFLKSEKTQQVLLRTGRWDNKNTKNCKLAMVTVSEANIYTLIATAQQQTSFCTWFHYKLLKPLAKWSSLLPRDRLESGLQRQKAVESFLAVCDDTMLDQWIGPGNIKSMRHPLQVCIKKNKSTL
jgi:hypothetical protein